ncbi:MAG: hypothetical protein DCC71_25130, partial [Proteobacteria bacterium]
VAAQRGGPSAEARATWDALAAQDPPALDPARIALARAANLDALGETQAAYEALAPAEDPAAPFDARAHGLAMRGVLADRLAQRDEARRLFRALLAHLESGPQYGVFEPLRTLATDGLAESSARAKLPMSWWEVGVSR